MTREDLILQIMNHKEHRALLKLLSEFFSSNVVIPRGKSPHPYADELHELAERPSNVEFSIKKFIKFTNDTSILEFRIKPSEPVYEWQWTYRTMDMDTVVSYKFLTDDEASSCLSKNCIKCEWTKRVRNA